MKLPKIPRKPWFLSLLAGAACLSATSVFAQVTAMDMEAERAELQQQQADQQARIDALESRMRAMESSGHAEVSVEGKKMMVTPWPDLDTFTRNLAWHTYVRAGAGFWGNGLGQTGSINLPGVNGRMRLGNENDFYMETGPELSHIIGEEPDDIDVGFKLTMQFFNGVDKRTMNLSNEEFQVGIVETYMTAKNVLASDPGATFWAGLRFYDRYDIHPQDYFFVGTAGMGTGITDWDVGIGKLNIAYFGAIESGAGQFWFGPDRFTNFTFLENDGFATGDLYRHILDIRLGEIGFLGGKLKLLLEGAYQMGGDFTTDKGGFGHAGEAWGVGGGAIQTWGDVAELHWVQAALMYGYGIVDWRQQFGVQMGRLNNAYNAALTRDDVPADEFQFENIDFYQNQQEATANVFWIMTPSDNFTMGTWVTGTYEDQGYDPYLRKADGTLLRGSGDQWQATAGIRPYLWLSGPFAIQASIGGEYISNSRGGSADNFDSEGWLGVFTIAPTLKPRGGFYTRPELRLFATYSVWNSGMKGQVGYNDPDATSAWIFGFQGEIWF